MSAAVDQFLERLERVKRSGEGWVARCPAHEDRVASLSVAVGDEGRVLVQCFAGCAAEAIVGAVNLTMSDLFEPGGNGNGHCVPAPRGASPEFRPEPVDV